MLNHWMLNDTDVGSDNPLSVTADKNQVLAAVFVEMPPEIRDLFIEVVGNGTTNPSPGSHVYSNATVVPVEAFPDPGWMLDHWMLDDVDVGSSNPLQVTMDKSHVLAAVFAAIPIEMRDLFIEVVGNGTTSPSPGGHVFPNGVVVLVAAFPDPGWMLDHWMLGPANVGFDNPLSVTADKNQVLTAIFVETSPVEAIIGSCNSTGGKQDLFNLGETVYVSGVGYSPSTTYNIYIVADVETWSDGMTIPSRASGTATTVVSDVMGGILSATVWVNPQTLGKYDIVVDVNGNGVYDAGIDALDDNDVEVTAGFVIPELQPALILPLFMILTMLAIVTARKERLRAWRDSLTTFIRQNLHKLK
jgi:hypothetical protein